MIELQVTSVGAPVTGTVVVFYRPDRACFERANRLAAIGPCVVVDNTEGLDGPSAGVLDARIEYVRNGRNLGIATAINQGIDALIRRGCASAMIFDQDSEPSMVLLDALPRSLERELKANPRIALVGPAYEDARLGGVVPFVRFGYFRLRRVAPAGTAPVEVDFLISSGSCINLAVWREMGPMDDALFIDFVDLEWCARARAKGYSVLGLPALRMRHSLGGEPVRIFGRAYPGHSALRHYYMFRNAVALIRRNYLPWSWKSTELVKLPFRLVIYGLFMPQGIEHVRMSLLGLWHGVTGRMGPLSRGPSDGIRARG
ncbi:glycosyltransferase family 2 protein [Paraburkholderia caballeronis]|uniref:Rhamnosyltransferase n=1 Tax=Paraburkholderia caballeronis TaxID=416943 RepID=A0A1H7R459_9BURK|nr:glycosyltransferase family 2 protein [Paraburkholderia caballeronis]PXW23669.1 rhamnosyltransferase [Paraburkholderia caballeronis]PXW99010.1 rhamnosyltransferase [Paraburkholderia caballeronis]RAJ96216.1 rhamnosyltransferase [Paraburkholderia caballeronis]SEC82759.1 rhamnosyltransferase [Paraburkholderia caballeronis]SEL54963.1 rhamnosyltransferase [Paraburkholderia caballeronis]